MLEKLTIVTAATQKAAYETARHNLIATNIANVDTPGYAGRDLAPFSVEDQNGPKRTRTAHLHPSSEAPVNNSVKAEGFQETLNGNKVDIEDEMAKAAKTMHNHNMATAIWQKSLAMLRLSLGERR